MRWLVKLRRDGSTVLEDAEAVGARPMVGQAGWVDGVRVTIVRVEHA